MGIAGTALGALTICFNEATSILILILIGARYLALERLPVGADVHLFNFSAGGARSSRLPNPAGLLRVHGLAFGALKRLAELFEVLDGAIHAHPSR